LSDQGKESVIVPVYKKSDNIACSKYRRISVLPIIILRCQKEKHGNCKEVGLEVNAYET
jgi:hypothetical protein